jgi:hypothetical protein
LNYTFCTYHGSFVWVKVNNAIGNPENEFKELRFNSGVLLKIEKVLGGYELQKFKE